MEKKILLPAVLAMLTVLVFMQPAECAATINVYGYVDKRQYSPGETVTLKLWVYNEGPDEVVLKNITIYVPWYSPMWGGDYTISAGNAVLGKGQNWTTTKTFTIPDDGRIYTGGSIKVEGVYTIGSAVYTFTRYPCSMYIPTPYEYALVNMDRLLTLITVQIVLVIVCTIILAATIFLSMRRPKVVLGEELEKTE
ncbi:MAG: hypothetical protein QXL54_02795 [Candidatus Bathyarchaeia archaeon]